MENSYYKKCIVKICFKENIYASEIADIMYILNLTLFAAEKEIMSIITNEMDLDPIVRDACFHRLDNEHNRAFKIIRFKEGSFGIEAIIFCLAYFILKATIGEDVKIAWQKSRSSNAIQKIMSEEYIKMVFDSIKKRNNRLNNFDTIAKEIKKQKLEREKDEKEMEEIWELTIKRNKEEESE